MTEKEKVEAYDEALERARAINNGKDVDVESGTTICEYIFPELKESEDDKIRKEIISILRNTYWTSNRNRFNELVAWLEKQGEQKPQGKSALEAIKEENVNNANKVEPKFKVGNWYQCIKDFFGKGVTFDKNTAYYCAKEGCLQDEYGCHIAIVKDLYDNFKLWTIEDAKDGDVLACDINKAEIGGDIEKLPNIVSTIFNFKKLINIKDYIHSYCHLYDKRFLGLQRTMYYNSFVYNISPATKEQRDTLERAMTNDGYRWNKEELKLEKI